MAFDDWVVYTNLITYGLRLPKGRADDADVLESFSDQYYDWDKEGRAPTGT